MAELGARDRLLPSLLDRLTNDNPTARQEASSSRTWTLRQAHQAVVRDLAWLLNAHCRPESDNLEELPEVFKSVLNYGLPDLCGLTVSGLSPQRMQRMIADAIFRFEPRIIRSSLVVQMIPGDRGRANSVVIEIKGQIWASPAPDSLYLRSEVDLESGSCRLIDKQYG